MYGMFVIGDVLTFWHQFAHTDGVATDATGTPTYAVYEESTDTAILSGNMAKQDDSGTTGFYYGQVTLSAANGLEVSKSYVVRVSGTVTGNAQAHIVARFTMRPNFEKLIRYFVNASSRNANTGTITVRNDGDTADAYTMTETVSGSTVSKGALSA